ncbi:Fe-S cluster assembly sulfur transfer protein SufU [Aestuariimicrobium ganziense]|uniref:Fe-S cluster assembly sulfur transfer protein SufU n=1 Tax=Aestuariimicrobium ganziense TaxID=2773677 RepID=UPI001941E6A6|nr:SUF system NifU family Fe-S cluster assembly protein [Aestuariimicrobium ganziense]
MNVEDLYQEIILDHYRERHHSGLREPFGAEVHHVNPSCGDEITLRVALAGDEIADISYDAVGCSISQASTSVMADLLIGRDIDDAMALYDEFLEMMNSRGQATPDEDRFEDAIAFVGVSQFPARVKCALLGWAATRDAVARAQTAETQSSETQTVDTQTGETRAATTDLPTPPQEAS